MKEAVLLLMLIPLMVQAAESMVVLSVQKMDCPMCPITVKKSLERVEGVSDVKVSLENKEAVVKYDDVSTDVVELQSATANAGYPSFVKK